jgi:replication-associated recombination protein RarA
MNSLFGNTPVLSPQFLPDKYRPRTWAEVIGQEKAIKQIQTIAKRSGYGGRAWWFSGKSGVGKTTIAMLIARELASDMSIVELDAGEITPAVLKDIEATMRTFGLGEKTGRAWIFNEAHGLRKDAIRKLLTLIETPLPRHVCFVFTTTLAGQKMLFEEQIDASPLLQRCTRIELAQQGLAKAFAERAREIAIAEGLDGQPLERYIDLVNENKGSLRGTLEAIERGAMQLDDAEVAE